MILNEFFESNKGGSEVKLNELGPAALAALGAAGGAGAWLVNKMFPDEGDPQFKKPEPPPEIKKPPQKPDDLDYSKRETLPSTRQGMGPRPERTVKEVDAKVEPPAGSWQDIWKQNPDIKNPHLIFPGQQIKLPNNTFAVVDRGDTLSGIAQRYQQGGYNTGREIAPNAASSASVRPAAQPAVPAARPAAQPTAPAARPAAQPSRTAQISQSAMASFPTKSGRVYAADFNNPSGIGWDGKGKYTSYKSPEEGVLATKNLVSRYISNQTPYIKGPATPEQVVSTWVSGGVTPAEKIQGGRYLQSVRNELAAAGVKLDSQGRIPNTQAATDAITRAIVRHETSPKHLDKFAPYLNPKQAVPEDVTETSDYFRRREREEAIISGQKPARKKQPVQTSDYARRREQEKKAEKGVAEGSDTQLSIQQLATISDEALDNAYGYGRSSPGNTFGWQANLMSAAYAKKMIDAGVTDIEKISDAIHKGWNVTAQKFVQNPDQFDDTEKLRQAGKLEAKLQQRAKLMKINYAQLDNEEQEKDRVVARALLQAIKNQQGVAEGYEPGDKITWYHSNHHPEIEGTVVGWKDGHLIVKSIDPQPRNTEKTVAKYRVPKNNILSHDKQGVAEERIQEIQRTPGDKEGLSTKGQNYGKETLSKIKMLPGSQRFGYTAGEAGRAGSFLTGADYIIELFDVKHPKNGLRKAGFLSLRSAPWFPIKNSYQVANVGLDDEYRGQGLGQNLYGIAMKLLGMTIVADDSQTPQARSSWLRLSQIPGVSINGYTSVFADDWDNQDNRSEIYDESAKRLISALVRAGGQELGESSPFVYVSFPVGANVDKTELQSIQKGISIYSARHPEDGGTSNGLYARWTGK